MNNNYPECLEYIGLKVVGKFITAGDHTDIECLLCGNVFNATPKSKMQNFKRYRKAGCPKCTWTARYDPVNHNNERRMRDMGYEIISEYTGLYEDIEVINNKCSCGRSWKTKPAALLTGRAFCRPCNDDRKRKLMYECNMERTSNALKKLSGFQKYLKTVRVLSEQTYRDNEQKLTLGGKLVRGKGKYHLDHIIPITFCYANAIPEDVCAHVENLQLLNEFDNISKSKTITSRIPNIFKHHLTSERLIRDFVHTISSQTKQPCVTWESFGVFDAQIYYPNKNLAISLITFELYREQSLKNKYFLRNTMQELAGRGVRTIFVLENEWVYNQELVLLKIKHILGENTAQSIYGRSCTTVEISPQTKSQFLMNNHIQGNDKSNINLGLYYHDELVSVMTFSRPKIFMRGKNTGQQKIFELSRFATSSKYRVVGAFSKLLKHFQLSHDYTLVYSFADLRWSEGGMYVINGFELAGKIPSDYAYIVDGQLKHRWGFRKDMLRENFPHVYQEDKTEYQIMLNLGYDRIWDCGKLRFEVNKHKY